MALSRLQSIHSPLTGSLHIRGGFLIKDTKAHGKRPEVDSVLSVALKKLDEALGQGVHSHFGNHQQIVSRNCAFPAAVEAPEPLVQGSYFFRLICT